MEITISFSDEIAEQIQNLPDINKFVNMVVREALKNQPDTRRPEGVSDGKGRSRWVCLSEQIGKNPPLSGAGDYVRECSREFRDEFAFRHDSEYPPFWSAWMAYKYLCKSFVTFLWGLILNFQSVTSSKLLVRYLQFHQKIKPDVSL